MYKDLFFRFFSIFTMIDQEILYRYGIKYVATIFFKNNKEKEIVLMPEDYREKQILNDICFKTIEEVDWDEVDGVSFIEYKIKK